MIKGTEKKVRQQQGLGHVLGPQQTGQSQVAALNNQLDNVLEEKERLTYKAPFTGLVVNRSNTVGTNRWYGKDSYLLSVIIPRQWQVIAYVPEESLYRLQTIGHAFFLSTVPNTPALDLKLLSHSISRADSLEEPYLASLYGGSLSVNTPGPKNKLLPLKQSVFPFIFRVTTTSSFPPYEQRGVVVIEGKRESIIKRFYLHALSLFVRESTF